jgi:peptide/nickel transport system permease protein
MSHWTSNIVVVLLIVGALVLARAVRGNRLWLDAVHQIWRRRPVSVVIVLVFVLVAILDTISWVGGIDPDATGNLVAASKPRSVIDRIFEPESFRESSYSAPLAVSGFYDHEPLTHPARHLLGTDILGNDVLYRTFKGVRVALLIGGFTSLIVIPIALFFGVSAGYFGGRVDDAVVFIMTVFASVPSLLLLIAFIMALGTGTVQVCIALGVTGWVGFCRMSRGETLKIRETDYVEAARALGVSEWRIITRHVLPNLSHLIVITFALLFTGLVLAETVLSYLGVGLDGSWGRMIDAARDELSRTPIIWWNITGASVALFTLVLAVNLIVDAMRDILDPRTRRENQ